VALPHYPSRLSVIPGLPPSHCGKASLGPITWKYDVIEAAKLLSRVFFLKLKKNCASKLSPIFLPKKNGLPWKSMFKSFFSEHLRTHIVHQINIFKPKKWYQRKGTNNVDAHQAMMVLCLLVVVFYSPWM